MADRPNVLFVMADQLRHDFLGAYGAGFVKTPNLDRLAARGVVFRQAYSPHPVCVAARASLMTGMHALRTGVLDNNQFLRPDLAASGVETWPEILNRHGYYTAAIGKMHFYPWDARLGFQHRRVAEDKRWLEVRDDYWHFLHERGHRKYHGRDHEGYLENRGAIVNKLPWELQVDRWVGDQAVEFIRAHGREGPFAAMVSFPGPHCPYDPAPEFLEGLEPEAMPEPAPDAGDTPGLRERCIAGNKRPWNGVDYTEFTRAHMLKIRQHYAALVRQIDVEVGAILDALDEEGLSDSTAIVFTSDHGDYLGDHGLIGKATFYEASFHVPLIVAGPGIAPGACDDLVSLTDVTATMLRLAGAEVPAYMDSRPLPGLGIEGGRGHDHLIGALGDCWLSYRPPWRLAKYATGEATLFNVDEDPLEQHNRIDDPSCTAIRRELDGALTAAVMRGILGSHFAEKAQNGDGSQDPIFGREGWRRAYPQRIELSGLRVEA